MGPHGLWLECLTAGGIETLLVTAEEALPRLAVGVARPPRERALAPLAGAAQKRLPGLVLAEAEHRGLDRVVTLAFDGAGAEAPVRLAAELFGSRPNLILVGGDTGLILEQARPPAGETDRLQGPGRRYAAPSPPARPDPRLLEAAEMAGLLARAMAGGRTPAAALQDAFAGLSALWAREVVARAASEEAMSLAESLAGLLAEVAGGPGAPRLLLDAEGAPVGVAPLPLRHLPAERQRPAGSLGEAMERLAEEARGRHGIEGRRRELLRLVRRCRERLASRREKLAVEAAEFAQADSVQRMAEILVANQALVPRGAAEIRLPDYAGEPGAAIRIPLDPAEGAAANAERLFRTARRGRRGTLRVASRLAETDQELARLAALEPRLLAVGNPEELEAAARGLERMPHLLGPRERAVLCPAGPGAPGAAAPGGAGKGAAARPAGERRRGAGPEPRRFVSSEGLPILVGRDNEGNDHLTLHLARSEDLWLHVEGFPGSHVVVRMRGRDGGVPRQTLLEAAKLAAYYSQARSHGKVPVSYTLKKYVHKPRKSPPGLVTVTHEKTVIVAPDKALVARLASAAGEADTDRRDGNTDF